MIIAEGAGAVAIITTAYNIAASYSVPHDFKKGKESMDKVFDLTMEWGPRYDEEDQEHISRVFRL